MFLNQSCFSQKTKATPKDRQCGNTKPVQINRYPAGGPVKIVRPQIEGERCRQMSTVARVQKCTLAYSCSLGFRRWRRFISPSIAVLINCPVLSPGALTCSIPLMMSCVILAVTDCDLAFFDPVAMSTPLGCWCKTIYRKKRLLKALTCKTPCFYLVSYTLFYSKVKTKPGSVGALTGLLTTNQPESIEVAMRNNNTQREKILLFAACNAYVQCTAWRTSIAVFVHISAISRMRHAAHNGAVFFDGVGMASTDAITNDTPRRPSMVGCYVYLSGYAYPGWYGILLIISQCITSDRPIMVLLVGERSRSLANLLAGLPIPASDATITTVKKCLRTYNGLGYVYPAPHKTGAGRSNPNMYKATPDAASVFFVVRYTRHSMVWYAIQQQSYNRRSTAILSYHAAHNGAMCAPYDGLPSGSRSRNRTSRRPRMVTLAGQPQGWPVSLYAGIATPVNVTAPIERSNSSGDSLNLYKEAVYHG